MGVSVFDHDIGKEFKDTLQHLNINQFTSRNHPTVHLGFKEALQLMPCSIWWMDRNHIYIGCNIECCDICEVDSPNEIIGKDIYEAAKMPDWTHFKAKNVYDLDEFIMQTGIPEFNVENVVPQTNRASIRQLASKKAIFNINNEVIGLMGAGIDSGQFGVSKAEKKYDL